MKNNYLIRMVFTLLLCASFSMTYAADWYISTTGNDATGDGSVGNPWVSFSKAYAAAASGDIIHVSGMIDFTADPGNTVNNANTSTGNKAGISINKNITIQGTSPSTDGFSGTNGANTTRFFQFLAATNYTLTLKNLKLANGVAQATSGGAGGGAILMQTGNIVAENVVFDGNTAAGNNSISGAAVYIGNTNTLGTTFTNCVFLNNKAERGGAVFINNWAAGTASVPSIFKFENCSFIGNECKNPGNAATGLGGSALYVTSGNDFTTLNIINSTFSKNKVFNAGCGGTITISTSKQTTNVNIINCTISENTIAGGVGAGAGVYVMNNPAGAYKFIGNVYIKNSIIENNTASLGAYSDVSLVSDSPTICCTGSTTVPTYAGYAQVENSIIGKSGNTPSKIPAGNVISSYYNLQVGSALLAGLGVFNATTNSYPLLGSSAANYFGLKSLLSPIITDQLGNARPHATVCSAGAIEMDRVTYEKIWDGGVSQDPTITGNWANGSIPSATDAIVIPAGKTNYPLYSNDFVITSSLIESGATLTVAEGKVLTNNSAIVNYGSLILKSSATGTASLVNTIAVANVQLQRYLSSNQRGWRMLSNPLSSTTFTALATASNIPMGANYLGSYDSANNNWPSLVEDNFQYNKAYKVFITGLNGESPAYTTGPSNVTMQITGTATNTAPPTITTVANKYYLVANPYTAPISMKLVIAASTNLSNSVSYYNPTKTASDPKVKAGGYDAIAVTAAAVGDANDVIIPPMGAIFVQASLAGTINVPKSAIYTGAISGGNYNHKVAQTKVDAPVALNLDVISNNITYDNVQLRFKEVGTAGSNVDFGKLPNTYLDFYSIDNSTSKAISELELKEQTIPLGITSNLQNSFTIKVAENTIPAGYEAVLVDNLLNTTTLMTQGASYNFAVDANPASQGDARFAINLKTAGALSTAVNEFDSKINVWPNPSRGQFTISNGSDDSQIEISTINGQVIHLQKVNSESTTTIQTKDWAAGVYILKASNNGAQTTKKLIIQ